MTPAQATPVHRNVVTKAVDFRPRGRARLWLAGVALIAAIGGGVIALRQPSELEACRATCFDAYARCSGANAIQCTVARGDCESKCAAMEASDDPALAASQP